MPAPDNLPRMRGRQIKKSPGADQRAVAVADEVNVKALPDQILEY
jgi:hypothetical protein